MSEHFAGNALCFGHQQLESMRRVVDHGQQGDRTVLDAHLNGEAAADLAVVDGERAHFGFAFSDGQVAGAVVAHQHDGRRGGPWHNTR